jgi:hypothetical protein
MDSRHLPFLMPNIVTWHLKIAIFRLPSDHENKIYTESKRYGKSRVRRVLPHLMSYHFQVPGFTEMSLDRRNPSDNVISVRDFIYFFQERYFTWELYRIL